MIELTKEQQKSLDREDPPRALDPRTQETYVLVRSAVYDRLVFVRNEQVSESCLTIANGIRASQEAFWNDLPGLLKQPAIVGSWAAYNRKDRIGIPAVPRQMRRAIQRLGIPRGEYYMAVIRPRDLPPWEIEEVDPIHCHHQEDE